jgi:hypothetical protein
VNGKAARFSEDELNSLSSALVKLSGEIKDTALRITGERLFIRFDNLAPPPAGGAFFVLSTPGKPGFFCGMDTVLCAHNLRFVKDASFMLIHIGCNMQSKQCSEVIKHERCRVRASLHEDTFTLGSDPYFLYEDLNTGEPKMCFKRLIRHIGFPPKFELLKVDRYGEE